MTESIDSGNSDLLNSSSTAGNSARLPAPYLLRSPKTSPTAFIFAAPHSGRYYPDTMIKAARLSTHTLRLSEDAFVDRLFEAVPDAGASLLVATYARAFLDLNRAENELDASMFTPPLDERNFDLSHRVKAGLGIIPKLIAEGLPIYRAPLPAREALRRIEDIYQPYHQKLQALLDARKRQFGRAILIDCHSMPSESKTGRKPGRNSGPDIVLGDNWGSACDRDLTALAEELLIRAGFSVRRNVPYSGGFSTQHYGKPGIGIHALQIEINRAIYMDEAAIEPLACFEDIRSRLGSFVENLILRYGKQLPLPRQSGLPQAAE